MATLSANAILVALNSDEKLFFTGAAIAPQIVTFNQNDIVSMVAGQASAATVKETYLPTSYNKTSEDSYASMTQAMKDIFNANAKTIIKLKHQEGDIYERVIVSSQEIAAINGTVI